MTRSELRHACYRAKKNAATDKNRALLTLVEPLLQDSQTWSNFADEWDLMLDTNKNIVIIQPEVDLEFIRGTCLEIKMSIKKDLPLDDLSDRQMNIKSIVESQMLEGLMDWSNYNKTWKVTVNKDVGMIETQLMSSPGQKPVTNEMIQGSMKTTGVTSVEKTTIEVEQPKPMSAEEIAQFEQLLQKMKQQDKG